MTDELSGRLFCRLIRPGGILPRGWLKTVVEDFAAAVPGRLDTFWPDVRDNRWFGGTEDDWQRRLPYSDHGDNEAVGFERAPYWLDGAIPLAFVSGNEDLMRRVRSHVDHILSHQHEDGLLGPRWDASKGDDAGLTVFSQALAVKGLIQWYAATGDARVPVAVEGALRYIHAAIQTTDPLTEWSRYRWFEILQGLLWLRDVQGDEPWMTAMVELLQRQGFDWTTFLLGEDAPRVKQQAWTFEAHVVNVGMQLREPLLVWLAGLPGRADTPAAAVESVWAFLDEYHGMPTGMFTGDECLAGKDPSQGTELCAVVEALYSLEVLIAGLNPQDTALTDRLERIVFNALPAPFSKDWNRHQYDQQVNQIECSLLASRCWTTNFPDANLFGLQPNYGCCTGNMTQGWAKFVTHLWLCDETADEVVLTAMSLAPCAVSLELQDGTPLSLEVSGEYPFRQQVQVRVQTTTRKRVSVRVPIPAWACEPHVAESGVTTVRPLVSGVYAECAKPEDATHWEWCFALRREPCVHRHGANGQWISLGPLVMSVPLESVETAVSSHNDLLGARWHEPCDCEVFAATEAVWNRVPKVDADTGAVTEYSISSAENVFACVPLTLQLPGATVRNWEKVVGSAGPLPIRADFGDDTTLLTLIPYGCTQLRVTVWPC